MEFRTVRGMQDFLPERAAKKRWIENACVGVFESYGFLPLETPVIEEFKLLAKKGSGGEAVRDEIYCFRDKSGRELGLRFDLTVPLARVAASNPQLPRPFKRYAVGRVYRYDRPQSRRYREFTQADWDILGSPLLLADFEVIAVAIDVMRGLGFKGNEFKIRLNSRVLLEEAVVCCGVPKSKVVECFRVLDKLDRVGEAEVKKELRRKKMPIELVCLLREGDLDGLGLRDEAPLRELQQLMRLLRQNGLAEFVEIDLCLVRGLEYYTGMVFEVCVEGSPSVGGGGRYDGLVELYGGKPTPAVGGSFGVERLLECLGSRLELETKTRLFLIPVGGKAVEECLRIAAGLRDLGLNCELDLLNRGVGRNIQYADKRGIPFVAIVGEKELRERAIALKNLRTGKQRNVSLGKLSELKGIVEER